MAKISRATQVIFGSTGNVGTGGFGAAAVGNTATEVATSQTLATLQASTAYPAGWNSATLGASKFPAIEDMNSLDYMITTQLAYLFQAGIAEYDSGTTYFIGSLCVAAGTTQLYKSLTNTNVGNALSSTANWQFCGDLAGTVTKSQTITGTNHTFAAADIGLLTLRSNSGTVMVDTLPGTGAGVLAAGWRGVIQNNDASALMQIIVASGANLNGSNSNSVILGPGQKTEIFSDGSNYFTKDSPQRARLGAATTFYVATTGSDSNNGLTSGSAFLTIQHAINVLAASYDLSGYGATISVADGTYTGAVAFNFPLVGQVGSLTLTGDVTTPANCIISVAGTAVACSGPVALNISGFKITTSVGAGLQASNGAVINITGNMNFGSCATTQILSYDHGEIFLGANYTVSAGAVSHLNSDTQGEIKTSNAITITVSGTPAFSVAFATATAASLQQVSNITFSGSATGVRYTGTLNSVINTAGGGANYFPGNSAGSVATGAQYA